MRSDEGAALLVRHPCATSLVVRTAYPRAGSSPLGWPTVRQVTDAHHRRRRGPTAVELAVAEAGEGGRPLVLVHGFTRGQGGLHRLPRAARRARLARGRCRTSGATGQPQARPTTAPTPSTCSPPTCSGCSTPSAGRSAVALGHSMGGHGRCRPPRCGPRSGSRPSSSWTPRTARSRASTRR